MNQDEHSDSKRSFIKYGLAGGAVAFLGTVLYPIVAYLKPPEVTGEDVNSVNLGKTQQFPTETGTIFRFGNKPGILIHTKEGDFRAFSATCTHLDCTVQYKKDNGTIWCACHNGVYDLTGRNISGPPPRPLTPFDVVIKNDEVIVVKS
jgi:Rieske Fe-S protein